MVLWTRLLWVAEPSQVQQQQPQLQAQVQSFYSKPYSTPGSINFRDCIKDDAQIALLDLILILGDSTDNYQEMMFIPPDNN